MPLVMLAGCVDAFDGSKVELFFHGGVHVPGDPAEYGRPPSDTHYELYVAKDHAAFRMVEFDIRPAIKIDDPCFIEEAGSRFAGLHASKIREKLIEAARKDGMVTDEEAGDIAQAGVRIANMLLLQSRLKVFTAHETGLTNALLGSLLANVPPAGLIDDETNATRLAECQQIWHAHPGYYVGTDKVLAIPLNGTYYGIVEAMDPRNGALLGGGSISLDASFPAFDALRINWNWNDPEDPRKSDYAPSSIGYHYMAGRPVERVRGVLNVTLVNQDFNQISGEASIFTKLGQDDVHF